MKQLGQVCAALRRKNRVHSALLAGCCFFSVLLITAYGIMMRSPTILAVLPEGGDSRKQVLMIFVMAVIGCAMFTVYASGLFFRHRSRQTGILLALGASRLQLRRQLNRELAVLAAVSCAAGAVLAAPLAWGIWQLFRLFVVDSAQMTLRFEPRAWAIALGFSVFVAVLLFAAGGRSVRQANIIETVQEVHRSEPIRAVPRWYGPLGIFLLAAGGLLGYLAPSVFVNLLHWYPPAGLSSTASWTAPAPRWRCWTAGTPSCASGIWTRRASISWTRTRPRKRTSPAWTTASGIPRISGSTGSTCPGSGCWTRRTSCAPRRCF